MNGKFRYLPRFLVLVLLLAATPGCVSVRNLQPRTEAYADDPAKSFALNTLHGITADRIGLYDSPSGGGFLRNLDDVPPRIDPGEAVGDAVIAGMDAAAANSLSNFGVSSGVEAGFAGGLILLGAMADASASAERPMIGKAYMLFGWLPQEGRTKEQVRREVNEAIEQAMAAAVAEYPLPEGFAFAGVEMRDESGEIYWSGSATLCARVVGGFCDEGDYSCAYRVRLGGDAIVVAPGTLPESSGGKPGWLFVASPSRFALPLKDGNAEFKAAWEHDDLPLFPEAPFFTVLSRHLPADYFINIPPKNKYGCSPAPAKEGLACREKPLLLNQGREHRFVTPPPMTAAVR
ncbi:MAG: hypothetical protein RBT16_13630 [Desulfococcus multivorans]|jgi:hypothetical protein|nr:hypothetical protein [Desulfococcus multivorans]